MMNRDRGEANKVLFLIFVNPSRFCRGCHLVANETIVPVSSAVRAGFSHRSTFSVFFSFLFFIFSTIYKNKLKKKKKRLIVLLIHIMVGAIELSLLAMYGSL